MKTKILLLGASLLIATGLLACETDKASSDAKTPETPKVTTPSDKAAKPVAKPTDKTAKPTDKKAADAKPGAVTCQKDQGCPPHEKLEACSGDLEPKSFMEGLDTRNPIKSGTKVVLVGPLLMDAGCTEMACDQPCCNSCTGDVRLGTSNNDSLKLMDEKSPDRFKVKGDETMVCTPFPQGEVVVQGEFVIIKGEYGIKNPTFCKR